MTMLGEYRDYVASFARLTDGLGFASSGPIPGCKDCGLPDEAGDEARELCGEPFFSWCGCDFCGSRLGGNREHAHAWLAGKICHFTICEDCVYFLEYGRLDDSRMLDLEHECGSPGKLAILTRQILGASSARRTVTASKESRA